jgi:hypothetical protein
MGGFVFVKIVNKKLLTLPIRQDYKCFTCMKSCSSDKADDEMIKSFAMVIQRIATVFLTVLMLSYFPQLASAQNNLVYNGGFEISSNGNNADGWVLNKWAGVSAGGNPGRFTLLYNDSSSDPGLATVSQTVNNLVPGDSYIISGNYELWKNPGRISIPTFGVAIDGTFLFETTAPANALDWQNFSFTFVAVSSTALLSLSSHLNDAEVSYGIDNIAMNPVPEPSASWLLLFGSSLSPFMRRIFKNSARTTELTFRPGSVESASGDRSDKGGVAVQTRCGCAASA